MKIRKTGSMLDVGYMETLVEWEKGDSLAD